MGQRCRLPGPDPDPGVEDAVEDLTLGVLDALDV